jgi:hypothetical protein
MIPAIVWFLMLLGSANAQQLMEPGKLAAVRASLPVLEVDEANQLLHSDKVIWYTTREIRPAYQHQNGNGHSESTFHDPYYNISADPSDAGKLHHGNAALEFPWVSGRPGGAHNSWGVTSVKGFHFPKPAAVFRRDLNGRVGTPNVTRVLDWVFSDGTVFFEVIFQRMRNEDVVFEVRQRTKVDDVWEFDVFRPFATAEDLADALEEMPPNEHRDAAIVDLRADQDLPYRRLVDGNHTRKFAFDATTQIYSLPKLRTDDVVELLQRPFVSCFGIPFKDQAYAPSNDTKFVSLVPVNYAGAFVSSTGLSSDCMDCHDSACSHATEHQDRGWYGRVQGSKSDKILSWHPVEHSAISASGFHHPVRLRQAFVNAGLVVQVQGGRLPPGYKVTKVDE